MEKVKVLLYYKIWGFKDKEGNPDYAYVCLKLKKEDLVGIISVDSSDLEDLKECYRKILAKMMKKELDEVLIITREEYVQEMGEDEDEGAE